jgi:hypothetical protein
MVNLIYNNAQMYPIGGVTQCCLSKENVFVRTRCRASGNAGLSSVLVVNARNRCLGRAAARPSALNRGGFQWKVIDWPLAERQQKTHRINPIGIIPQGGALTAAK